MIILFWIGISHAHLKSRWSPGRCSPDFRHWFKKRWVHIADTVSRKWYTLLMINMKDYRFNIEKEKWGIQIYSRNVKRDYGIVKFCIWHLLRQQLDRLEWSARPSLMSEDFQPFRNTWHLLISYYLIPIALVVLPWCCVCSLVHSLHHLFYGKCPPTLDMSQKNQTQFCKNHKYKSSLQLSLHILRYVN